MPVALLLMLLLALYLALYPALMAVLTAEFVARAGLVGLWLAPAVWVGTEFARSYLFGGFPWVPLGNSQVELLPVAQLASVVGVYGLSGLVVLINTGIAVAFLASGRVRLTAGGLVVGVLVLTVTWGTWRIAEGTLTSEGMPLRVGLIQGNIAQEDKWQPSEARRIFTTYVAMTREAVRNGAEYVLWPESATPFMFEEDPIGEAAVRTLVRELGVPMLIGSEEFESEPTPRLYNAAFQLSPDGTTTAVYRKNHLVPFGEYVPFRRWLFFVSPLVDGRSEFASGQSVELLPVRDSLVSTAICYEVVYPSLIRQAVRNGSELLTTITNDGWYGDSSAPYQHFAMASMRAIEQGRYLVRAANTGISGIVDPYGRVVQASSTFEEATLVGEVRLLKERTLYSRLGDVVAYLGLLLTTLTLVTTGRRR